MFVTTRSLLPVDDGDVAVSSLIGLHHSDIA
jgi:hypothetical protein